MTQIHQFKNLINEYIAVFDQLIIFENNKLDTIAANDVERLDALMRDEQAYLLKLKGLDLKREKLQKEMNMDGFSFREIIENQVGQEKDDLQLAYQTLSKCTEEMKAAANSTKLYIELHLHSLDILISKLGGDSKSLYDKSGSQAISSISHFESKKV